VSGASRNAGRLLGATLLLSASSASAAGLYFSDRGVKPMGRAGAYVAGCDDLHGIWYNPAGIVDAGTSVLVDFTWVHFSIDYRRRLRIVDADDTVRVIESPSIKGSSPVLPLPTLAASVTLDADKKWVLAGGVVAPYIALASYADHLDDGQPSPARYTLGSFSGSALALPGLWLAWRPTKELRLGIGTMALLGRFQSTVTFTVCPQDRLVCAPEQPEWDAASQMRVGPIFAPTANAGIIWEPDPHVRLGFSGQLPMVIDSDATIKVRLPGTSAVDSASVRGESARVKFTLPATIRLGVELRPFPDVKVEAAYVREFWSAHQTIEARPKDIYLENITGAPKSLALPNISIPRGFTDSNSFRIGGEYEFPVSSYRIALRTGLSYETSAVPADYLSLSSLDFAKTTVAIGGSLSIGKHWRFDALLAHMFTQATDVDVDTAKIPRISPLTGNAPLEAVNAGRYEASADLIGCGFAYTF